MGDEPIAQSGDDVGLRRHGDDDLRVARGNLPGQFGQAAGHGGKQLLGIGRWHRFLSQLHAATAIFAPARRDARDRLCTSGRQQMRGASCPSELN